MTALENFYFGNINPSEYKQDKDTKKKLAEMTKLLDELRSMLTTEEQKEKLEQIESYQLSLIALSEKDAYIEGFKLGVRMTTAPTIRLTADNPAQTTIRAINSPALTVTAAQALSQRAVQAAHRAAQADQRAAVLLNHRAAAVQRATVLLSPKAVQAPRRAAVLLRQKNPLSASLSFRSL